MPRPALYCLAIILIAAVDASAHHSRAYFYDSSRVIEAEGVITRILWRNPHTRFWLRDDNGEEWELESTPPATLVRHGLGPEALAEGTRVRVAGPAARFEAHAMEVHNVLLPDGRELLIQTVARPRWTEDAPILQPSDFAEADVVAAEASATGIFRVWSREYGQTFSLLPANDYPLTEAAQAARDAYDPVADNPIPGCTAKGMPMIMSNPLPFEFVDEGDEVHLKIEEYDLVRIIHLDTGTGTGADTGAGAGAASPSILGHSVGRWEDGDLVVTTTQMNFMHYGSGIALSADAHVHERFELSGDERRLDYTLTVTDPETFTEPLTARRHWVWMPGETVKDWSCAESP